MSKIGILEDDLRVARFIETRLVMESHEVETFSLIDEMLDMLNKRKFHILIMDRMIGQIDSLNLIKTIKNNFPELKIIMVSALSDTSKRIKDLEIDVDGFLEKPFQYHELSAVVKKINYKDNSSFGGITNSDEFLFDAFSLCKITN